MALHITLSRKLVHIGITWCSIIGIIILRLLYLQITLGDYFLHKSKKNFLRTQKIPSYRGNILDCHGTLLATNRPRTHIYWKGTGNRRLSYEQHEMLHTLCAILDLDFAQELEHILPYERGHKKTVLAYDITFAQLSKIEEQFPAHANIRLETQAQRHYPYGPYASHVIGYLGNIRDLPQGVMGLEKLQHDILRGSDGTLLQKINSFGRSLMQKEIEKSLSGNDVCTTLDIAIQHIAEQVFPTIHRGTLIVMNPRDGAIQALVSRPTFDPGMFLNPISTQQWQTMQQDKPFINRALSASYALGSIFKLVTVSALLEHDLIEPDSTWDCNGFFYYSKRKYWCNRRWGHGTVNAMQSVAQSCNIMFFDIGTRMDIDVLADYAQRFGLGQKTGIALPENCGIVPSRSWKLHNRGEPWWQGETLSVAIGQSFLVATPIQIVRMISAIFTGYLVRPRILASEPMQCMPFTIKPETREFLKESMKSVVTRGTGRRVSTIKDIEIYAKTSTAQVTEFGKRKKDKDNLEHAWFVAHVTYKDHDPLVIAIVVENSGTSRVATTIARDFLVKYKQHADSTL